jgi:actin-like ATPase involved in cell morphogenesis
MAGRRFGIELSPDRVEAWVKGDGLVFAEPAVAARTRGTTRWPLYGAQALQAASQASPDTELAHPFGITELADEAAAEQMLRYLIARIVGRLVFARHELVMAVPAELSTSARRVLLDVALASGARMAHLLDLPLAMAFGAGLPVTSWEPSPVLFLLPQGAQVAIVCHHGLLAHGAAPLREGGPGPSSQLGLSDRGLEVVAELVMRVIEEAPPSAYASLQRAGLVVAGRGLNLEQSGTAITSRTGIRTRVVADPEHCVVKGAEVALERIEAAGGRSLLYLR